MEVIDCNSIMIGDWVKLCNKKGEWLDYSQVDLNLLNREEEGIIIFKPVPITTKILEQNGFQEGCSSHYILYDDKEDDDSEPVGGYEIRFYPGNNFCSIQNLETEADISFYCKYIHQLQHAMRLCGIEKEITLN